MCSFRILSLLVTSHIHNNDLSVLFSFTSLRRALDAGKYSTCWKPALHGAVTSYNWGTPIIGQTVHINLLDLLLLLLFKYNDTLTVKFKLRSYDRYKFNWISANIMSTTWQTTYIFFFSRFSHRLGSLHVMDITSISLPLCPVQCVLLL